jgi:hypothetical protein
VLFSFLSLSILINQKTLSSPKTLSSFPKKIGSYPHPQNGIIKTKKPKNQKPKT